MSYTKTFQLERMACGRDLWPAIEAAQYARAILHDAARSPTDADRIRGFIAAFSVQTERWEDQPPAAQAAVLDLLGRMLKQLADGGLSVHACATSVALVAGTTMDQVPLAILHIGPSRLQTLRLALQYPFEVAEEEDGSVF